MIQDQIVFVKIVKSS